MASITVNLAPTISSGTATVYPQSNWPYGTAIAGAPVGASVTTGTVGTDGSVTFSGLTASTLYVAYQASPDRYVRFRTAAAAASTAAGKFDSKLLAYNCDKGGGAFALFRAALAKGRATATPTAVHFLGDSTMGGYGATPRQAGALGMVARSVLSGGKLGTVSDGIGLTTADSRSVQTNWASLGGLAGNGGFARAGAIYAGPSQATASNLVFTPETVCDSFNLYLWQSPQTTPSFGTQIDSGSVVTQSGAAGSQSGYGGRVLNVPCGSRGMHTLMIVPPTAAGYVALMAIEPVDSAASLRFNILGVTGTTSADWVNATSGITAIESLATTYDLPTAPPSLSVVLLGENDFDGAPAVSVANYITNLTAIIAKQRAKNGDVLLTGIPPTNYGHDDRRASYVNALYGLCDSLNVGFFDASLFFPATFGTFAAEPYAFSTDTYHPSARGYKAWGAALADVIESLV